MSKIAFLFPGQGSQKPGMVNEFFSELSKEKQAAYEAAFPGIIQAVESESRENTDEMAAQLVYLSGLLSAEGLKKRGIEPDYLAGFSLGEITALGFSGALSGEDADRLLSARTKAMYDASEHIEGAMAAVNGLDVPLIEDTLRNIPGVYPVNYNSPRQTVISGKRKAVEEAAAALKQAGGKVIMLNVKGAFHTELMGEAGRVLKETLKDIEVREFMYPVLSNIDAGIYPASEDGFKDRIIRQVVSPVRFTDMVERLHDCGVSIFIETGFGKTLQGLTGRILQGKNILTCGVSDRASLEAALEKIKGFKHV